MSAAERPSDYALDDAVPVQESDGVGAVIIGEGARLFKTDDPEIAERLKIPEVDPRNGQGGVIFGKGLVILKQVSGLVKAFRCKKRLGPVQVRFGLDGKRELFQVSIPRHMVEPADTAAAEELLIVHKAGPSRVPDVFRYDVLDDAGIADL
jgi:hypothetical protein